MNDKHSVYDYSVILAIILFISLIIIMNLLDKRMV